MSPNTQPASTLVTAASDKKGTQNRRTILCRLRSLISKTTSAIFILRVPNIQEALYFVNP